MDPCGAPGCIQNWLWDRVANQNHKPRLLLSSLPSDITTKHLAEILSQPPLGVSPPANLDHVTPRPTDIKVLMTKQGRSRRMAFVGYKSDVEANWAKDVWQGVWINGLTGHASGSRVDVQWAKAVNECNAERTRSDLRPTTSASSVSNGPAPKRQKKPESTGKEMNPEYQAFLSTMQPRQHKSLVDDILEVPAATFQSAPLVETSEAPKKEPSRSTSHQSAIIDDTPTPTEITDKEYMARRMKRTIGGVDPPYSPAVVTKPPGDKEWDQDEPEPISAEPLPETVEETQSSALADSSTSAESCILETGRLFLRNLPFSLLEEDLMSLFSTFGTVSQVHIPLNHDRKQKGVAYVSFERPSDALAAYKQLDQRDFQGRLLHILPAVTRNARPENESGRGGKNIVKQEQDIKRKLVSSKQFNWASLYMNISKSELYDPDSQNPSIKLALAETHVITETKEYFEEQGINTEAFSQIKNGRSMTTLLVKNIPYGTTSQVLRGMFTPHGDVSRILIPPSGTIALVEMLNAEDTKSAFKSLAYKRIGNSVLYLERAPDGIWKPDAPKPPTTTSSVVTSSVPSTQPKVSIDEGEPGSTLFVKNISFSTTSEGLSSAFSTFPDFLFARLQTKPDPKNSKNRLSMGFGFVGFKTVSAAQHVIRAMQGYRLDAHAIEIRFANRGKEEEEKDSRNGGIKEEFDGISSTKLLVKNVPFETSKQELRELFGSFGKLKSVRLPKKLDRKTRGFGFIEYTTKKEAEEAMKSLRHTHLLGRHLVISYANDKDEDIEQLRAKSGGSFLTDQISLKKTKFEGLKSVERDEEEEDL
ncbi:multiple RNA-binding domain-containing protein 1 [Melampsora americana]|nr:multiple RNA-binding domain-containing protein 1 [Melampsora americana]